MRGDGASPAALNNEHVVEWPPDSAGLASRAYRESGPITGVPPRLGLDVSEAERLSPVDWEQQRAAQEFAFLNIVDFADYSI